MRKYPKITFQTLAPADYIEGWAALARAAVLQACKDAGGLNKVDPLEQEAAAAWLVSLDGILFCDLAGVDIHSVRRWVKGGCYVDRAKYRDGQTLFNRKK